MAETNTNTNFCTRKTRSSTLKDYLRSIRHVTEIDDLPVEILQNIFSYLPLKELYKNVSRASSRWRGIASNACLWKNIKIGPEIKTCELLKWLELAPRLKHFEMYLRSDADIVLRKVLKCNQEIESLSIHSCQGSKRYRYLSALTICQILTRCPYLNKISVRNTAFESCKFFELLITRDDFISKRTMKTKRKNTTLEYYGKINNKQWRTFLEAKERRNDKNIIHKINGQYF